MLRTRLKNVKTGRVVDVTFRMSDKVEEVRLEEKKMEFLYSADQLLHFMDPQTYDQVFIPEDMLGAQKRFLKEGNACVISFLEEQPICAELPTFAELAVAEAEPGFRGDSATNIMKNAVLETGARVQVPLFIKEGDVLKIDTRSGEYVERVSSS
jgi:elongation factor P